MGGEKVSLPKPYYQDSAVTIYHADCRDILPHLPKVDLVLTDPPYGIGFSEYESHKDDKKGYTEFIWGVCEEAERHLENGWMVVFQSSKLCRKWPEMFPRDWRLLACPKTFVQIFKTDSMDWATDYALFWKVGDPKKCEHGKDWVVSQTADIKNRPGKGHPCPRPDTQILHITKVLSHPGQLILDPFMGSGTTLRAAKDLGRKAIGIEIEEKYCEIAAKRMLQEVLPITEASHD
jgi:site-specific DNA-methyltransferase (adenine-specific)